MLLPFFLCRLSAERSLDSMSNYSTAEKHSLPGGEEKGQMTQWNSAHLSTVSAWAALFISTTSFKISSCFFHQAKWVERKCFPKCHRQWDLSWLPSLEMSSLFTPGERYQVPSWVSPRHTKLIFPFISLINTSEYCHSSHVTVYVHDLPWEFNELSIKPWISLTFMLGQPPHLPQFP